MSEVVTGTSHLALSRRFMPTPGVIAKERKKCTAVFGRSIYTSKINATCPHRGNISKAMNEEKTSSGVQSPAAIPQDEGQQEDDDAPGNTSLCRRHRQQIVSTKEEGESERGEAGRLQRLHRSPKSEWDTVKANRQAQSQRERGQYVQWSVASHSTERSGLSVRSLYFCGAGRGKGLVSPYTAPRLRNSCFTCDTAERNRRGLVCKKDQREVSSYTCASGGHQNDDYYPQPVMWVAICNQFAIWISVNRKRRKRRLAVALGRPTA